MARALRLARLGWGRVAPNPLVGAVLLRGGRVIGEGYHAEFGSPHAEVVALDAAGDARGATCVVTLEPCAHQGKTPPCADALVAAGVTRAVIALRDPHPDAGGGLERLREAGVAVDLGTGAEDAAALNAPFLWSTVRGDRPFVALKLATSLDGYVADAAGRSRWISGPEARAYVQWLRAGFDAIAVGRRTVERDDPQLTVRGEVRPRVLATRVVFARSGALSPSHRVIATAREAPTVVVTASSRREGVARRLEPLGVEVIGAEGAGGALRALRALGIRSLLVEGGGDLAGTLLDGGFVDRFYAIQAPRWLGQGVSAFGTRAATPLDEAEPWVVVERRALGADTLVVTDRKLCLPAS